MAKVIFSSELQQLTGEESVQVAAEDYRSLVNQLVANYAALDKETLMAMAVAIDGDIVHDPLLETVGADSEVHFLYKLSGG
ncbi:MAG: hypothetical protein ACR2PJ_04110 [Pseudomonadales bacterium]